MRVILGLALLLGAWGCRSEADETAELTRAATESCVKGLEERAAEMPGAGAGLDKGRFCDCVIKKSFAGKDLQELRARKEAEPGAAEVEAMGACVMDEARRIGGGAR
jgi:hypothetical protein